MFAVSVQTPHSSRVNYWLFVGLRLRPQYITAVVDEPFHVNCSMRDFHHNIDSSMLHFCVLYPNNSAVDVDDDYVHIVNRASVQLVYTLHTPSQNVLRTLLVCFLTNSSNVNCNRISRRSSKISTAAVGCK